MIPGFGFSVGDFIAVIKLVGTVIDALRDSPFASSSTRSLINELYALESALIQVKRLDPDVGHNFEKVALQQAASQCQRMIDAFYGKIQKDQCHLQQGGTDSKIKDAWVKIKWTVCKKEDLEKFRAEIRGHTSSITILLLALQMEATGVQTRKHDSQQKSLTCRMQDFSSQAMGVLTTVTDNLAESIQQGKALLESSAQIVQSNLRIFQIVHDIQLFVLRIPGQIQRQQPVYLIDPLNKETPFHLEFIRSSEALLAVLKINLKASGSGPAMIDRGEFAIEELGTQHLVDLTAPWDICFYPGQRVVMSMVFKQQETNTTSSCPSCGTDHQETAEKDITW